MATSFSCLGARLLIVLKLVGLHLPFKRSETSPYPWALCLWKPSSFLDQQAEKVEEVWTVETMVMIGWKMTWSGQIEAWAEEEEAWIVTSPAHPSPIDPQLGQASWWDISS